MVENSITAEEGIIRFNADKEILMINTMNKFNDSDLVYYVDTQMYCRKFYKIKY